MGKNERLGYRRSRKDRTMRAPQLGYYLIITDTRETEKNYFVGLRDSLPKEVREKIVIKVVKTETKRLVEECQKQAAVNPQYCEPWIVFDRDQVKNFDDIIEDAEGKGIHAGWSNSCIEVWFFAYFGKIPSMTESTICCSHFSELYQARTGQEYKKSNKDIYEKLCQYGDEKEAIQRAWERHQAFCHNGMTIPSQMQSCTMLYELVDEIKSKIK